MKYFSLAFIQNFPKNLSRLSFAKAKLFATHTNIICLPFMHVQHHDVMIKNIPKISFYTP